MQRARIVYVTSDSSQWLALDKPDGMISPPIITLHVPLRGPVEFYLADCYRLPVPAEAEGASNGG